MIGVLKYSVYVFILHQCISITSPAPSSSNQDLDDILSIPSGNIRPGLFGRRHFDEYQEDLSQEYDIPSTIDNVENTSKSMQRNGIKRGEKKWRQDTNKPGLIKGSGWMNDRKRAHLLNLLQKIS